MDTMRRRKDFDYFEQFLVSAKAAESAAKFLDGALTSFDIATVAEQVRLMHKIENDADMERHTMLKSLAREFMTPIEREDIVSLAQQMDNVVDAIDDVMQRAYMFNVQQVRMEALDFTKLIVKCAGSLVKVMEEFKRFRKSKSIQELCIEVNKIESDGDKLFAECMRRLYTDGSDLRHIIVWTTMFEGLEECLDACEDAVDIIEGVIMKNT